MISVSGKNWEEINLTKRLIDKIKIDYNFSEIVSKIILERKFNNLEIASISNEIKYANPFFNNKDFYKAMLILEKSIKKNEKILIFGDYDVDGCVSISLIINFLKEMNYNNYIYYAPNRFRDGYGPNIKLIKKLINIKIKTIVFLDCGSTSKRIIEYLNLRKIKTLIIDHHEIYKPYPNADCIINPKKECNYKGYDYLCSASLTYFLIDFFIKKKKLRINFSKNLIFVLLATITDVMPLRKLNRILIIEAIKKTDIKNFYIFNKIFEFKKIKRPLELDDFGYLIGPILNSAGRINDPNTVIELLTINDLSKKEKIIKELIILNEKRKKIEINTLNKLNYSFINNSLDNVIVQHNLMLNEGIIGIIAARLKDFFDKPSIVLTKVKDIYKGSARSNLNFNIGKFIKEALDKKILINGGGHNLAAGFSIKKDKIKKFTNYINNKFITNNLPNKKKFISKISINAINKDFLNDISKLAPFGHGNENPCFLIEKVKIIKPQILQKKYISFYIKSTSGKLFKGISFHYLESKLSQNLLNNRNEMSLVIQIKENLWNNKKNLQLIVIDLILKTDKA